MKKPTTFRLSEQTLLRLAALAQKNETTQTAALELAVREAADRRKLTLASVKQETTDEPD